jgi:hypothetical protein
MIFQQKWVFSLQTFLCVSLTIGCDFRVYLNKVNNKKNKSPAGRFTMKSNSKENTLKWVNERDNY